MLFRITCRCGHVGITSAPSLPRELTCFHCGTSRHVEPDRSARIMSTAAREEWVTNFLAAVRS
jgi:hypothetical protein